MAAHSALQEVLGSNPLRVLDGEEVVGYGGEVVVGGKVVLDVGQSRDHVRHVPWER